MHARTSWSIRHFSQSAVCVFLVFVAISFILYGNSLGGEFVYDDAQFAVQGGMRHVSYLWETWLQPSLPEMQQYPHYRPLTFFTFSLNYLLFGESPLSFHIVNVLLNAIACWLFFLLSKKLFHHQSLAWFITILFAVLPIHTEAIAYIKARDEILVALFALLSWLAFLKTTDTSKRYRIVWAAASACCAFLAFLSKESALVVPGLLGGTLLLQGGWKAVLRAWMPLGMHLIAIGAYFLLHTAAVGAQAIPTFEFLYFGQNPLGYMAPEFIPGTALMLLFVAVAMTFFPWNLSATYGFAHLPMPASPFASWMSIAGIVTLVIFATLLLWRRTRITPLGIGAFVFLLLYFPFSKIPISKGIDFFAERWLYAPSIGLAMIGGYVGWLAWRKWPGVSQVALIAIFISYVFVLIPRNAVWHDETTLGESLVRNAPNSVISYVFLANNRLQYARLPEAADLVTKGLSITRDHIPLHHVAAAIALSSNRIDIAEQAVQAAEKLGGDELANVILRATLLAKQHRYQESLDHIQHSKWFSPQEYRIRMLLALNLWMLGRHEEAEQYFDWDKYIPSVKLSREEKIRMFETY